MLYLFESEFPKNKSVFISLLRVFGVGKFNSILICKQLGFSLNFKSTNLSKEQINKILKVFEYLNLQVASDLRKFETLNLKKEILIKCYKGFRKLRGLPVRGQRTHTNCKTTKKLFKNMFNFYPINKNKNRNKTKNKVKYTLFCKEQLKYLKTTHSYHLVDSSPWPFVASLAGFMLTSGLTLYSHRFIGGWNLLLTGLFLVFYVMFTWWRDVVREATFEDQHSIVVQKGLKLGMLLFIVSEIMFFFAFFWSFFHSSIAPVYNIGGVWPPKAITSINTYTVPLTNTFILLSSGATVTWSHHALLARAKKQTLAGLLLTLILASLFTCLQAVEYLNAPFNISDSIFGSCFYMSTGFHGFHVFIGTIALFISFIRIVLNHFTNKHHFGFESAIWYWHFVDVVWLFLFINVYWWSTK